MQPYRDMEIVTVILSGRLEHRDTGGYRAVTTWEEIQHMLTRLLRKADRDHVDELKQKLTRGLEYQTAIINRERRWRDLHHVFQLLGRFCPRSVLGTYMLPLWLMSAAKSLQQNSIDFWRNTDKAFNYEGDIQCRKALHFLFHALPRHCFMLGRISL